MPAAKEVPRWKRRTKPASQQTVQLRGRHARRFTREYVAAAGAAQVPGGVKLTGAGRSAVRGGWRFRRHMVPFGWLGLLAACGLLRYAPGWAGWLAAVAVPAVMSSGGRQRRRTGAYILPRWTRGAVDVAAVLTAVWIPLLARFGVGACLPYLLLFWAPCTGMWMRRYRWKPFGARAAKVPDPPPADDRSTWAALAGKRKWNATLGEVTLLPGGGRKYPIRCDGIETVMGPILSASENIGGAWHKPMTEAYAERDPLAVPSLGYLTVLAGETLMTVREWDGRGMDPVTGMARFARFADGGDANLKLYTPMFGTKGGLISGTTGSGKSEMLNLLIFIALATRCGNPRCQGCFVPVILDPQEGQSLPFWRDRCLYFAGTAECHRALAGMHAGLLDRSSYLAGLRWDDDGIAMRGMSFFDHQLTGLPMPLIVFDEAHMALTGTTKAEREIVTKTVEIARLMRKAGLLLWLATHIPGLTDLGGEQALRDMLRGANVVSMRTANRVGGPMLGLEKDPSEIPRFFRDGKETAGLGYTAGPDNRPDAPMRTDLVPKRALLTVPPVPLLDDRWREAMSAAMDAVSPTSGFPPPPDDGEGLDDEAADPAGQRCVDAVWMVLKSRAADMDRGEVIKWVNDLATGAWERERGFALRSVTTALADLVDGRYADEGRVVIKPSAGVFRAVTTDGDGQ